MTRETAIYIRVSPEEKIAIERAARKEGHTISSFLRHAAMIEKYLYWDATAMREIRRQVEEKVEAWEKANAPKEKKRA